MVGLGGEDASGRREDVLVLDERGGAVVGGDTRVLEQEGAEQEVSVARVLLGQRGGHKRRRTGENVSLAPMMPAAWAAAVNDEFRLSSGMATALEPRAARMSATWCISS